MFARTVVPRDFDRIEIPFPEKGEPELVRYERPAPTRALGEQPSWLAVAIAGAGGFLAGVLLVAILGGPKGVVRTTTVQRTATVTRTVDGRVAVPDVIGLRASPRASARSRARASTSTWRPTRCSA